jgi:hypothetical protein
VKAGNGGGGEESATGNARGGDQPVAAICVPVLAGGDDARSSSVRPHLVVMQSMKRSIPARIASPGGTLFRSSVTASHKLARSLWSAASTGASRVEQWRYSDAHP